MKEFYGVEDIKKLIECSQSKAYDIIRQLRDSFKKDYPNAVTIQGKIPIWYFEEKVLCRTTK